MNDWDLRLVDYWDQRANAINENTLRLSKLSIPERQAACEQICDYVFLEADYQDGVLDTALGGGGAPGVLSIFRNDAPVAGSDVSVAFPDRRRSDGQ